MPSNLRLMTSISNQNGQTGPILSLLEQYRLQLANTYIYLTVISWQKFSSEEIIISNVHDAKNPDNTTCCTAEYRFSHGQL